MVHRREMRNVLLAGHRAEFARSCHQFPHLGGMAFGMTQIIHDRALPQLLWSDEGAAICVHVWHDDVLFDHLLTLVLVNVIRQMIQATADVLPGLCRGRESCRAGARTQDNASGRHLCPS